MVLLKSMSHLKGSLEVLSRGIDMIKISITLGLVDLLDCHASLQDAAMGMTLWVTQCLCGALAGWYGSFKRQKPS